MNLSAYLSGCISVLRGDDSWTQKFTLGRAGLRESYIALLLTVPAFYTGAMAIAQRRTEIAEAAGESFPALLPVPVFAVLALLFLLSYSACAYIAAILFDRQDRFAPWVIARHWCVFFMSLFVAAGYGAYLLGFAPFGLANAISFVIFMAILPVDIRLANRVAGFGWQGAVYAGCVIWAVGLGMLVFGMGHVSG